MKTNFVQELLKATNGGKLSPLIEILLEEGKDLDELETSEQYDQDEFKAGILNIEDEAQNPNVPNKFPQEYSAAVIAAHTAILVAGATNQSSPAMRYVARVCKRVFGLFQLELDLSEIQQYRVYRYAFDASRGVEENRDDLVLELRKADQQALSKDTTRT
ncbi:MAG: hypothetical protein O3C40_08670 [Planctomycetota bacterium]|nr:hypothetical protein [Planctomycetota bacterium]